MSLPSFHTHTHTHTQPYMSTQDGVTADQVAEVLGHHAVCEELRKHMHGDRRPLSKVRFKCIQLECYSPNQDSTPHSMIICLASHSLVIMFPATVLQ